MVGQRICFSDIDGTIMHQKSSESVEVRTMKIFVQVYGYSSKPNCYFRVLSFCVRPHPPLGES